MTCVAALSRVWTDAGCIPPLIVFWALYLALVSGVTLGLTVAAGSWVLTKPASPVSQLVAESVARALVRVLLAKLLLGVAATVVLVEVDHDIIAAFFVVPFGVLWLVHLVRARLLLTCIERGRCHLERRKDCLIVDRAVLYCSRRAWNRAAHVPTATIKKQ